MAGCLAGMVLLAGCTRPLPARAGVGVAPPVYIPLDSAATLDRIVLRMRTVAGVYADSIDVFWSSSVETQAVPGFGVVLNRPRILSQLAAVSSQLSSRGVPERQVSATAEFILAFIFVHELIHAIVYRFDNSVDRRVEKEYGSLLECQADLYAGALTAVAAVDLWGVENVHERSLKLLMRQMESGAFLERGAHPTDSERFECALTGALQGRTIALAKMLESRGDSAARQYADSLMAALPQWSVEASSRIVSSGYDPDSTAERSLVTYESVQGWLRSTLPLTTGDSSRWQQLWRGMVIPWSGHPRFTLKVVLARPWGCLAEIDGPVELIRCSRRVPPDSLRTLLSRLEADIHSSVPSRWLGLEQRASAGSIPPNVLCSRFGRRSRAAGADVVEPPAVVHERAWREQPDPPRGTGALLVLLARSIPQSEDDCAWFGDSFEISLTLMPAKVF